MVKSKGKNTDTGQKTDMKPPTIQVDEAPPGLPHKESFGRRTKEKVHSFFSNLRPSHSRARSRSEGGKSQEPLPGSDTNADTNTGDASGSVGNKNDMAEGIKSADQTLPESIGEVGDAADVTAGSVTELKTIDKAKTAIKEAQEQVEVMHTLGGGLQMGVGLGAQANTGLDKVDTVSNLLQPLKVFDSVIKNLGDLHPYAKIALSVLSWASQVILTQANRDKSVNALLLKISEVYTFMVEDGQLEKIVSTKDILSQTSQVMLECAKFIQSYSTEHDFFKRLGKGMFSDIDEAVATYNKVLDRLMEQFHRNAMRDVLVTTHDVRDDVRRTLEDLRQLGDNQYINSITYAKGAGLDTTKSCLDGTREEILHEVIDWVNSTDPNTPCILWLSGAAGTGKSAIAQTIARGMKDAGALGSCFCFEKGDVKRYTKMFSTISRDLASRDLRLKQALASVVAHDPSISTTADVMQQWEKLIMEPISDVAGDIVGRLVIVIDALDESGKDESREYILTLLAKEAAALPSNIRILLTSRPLVDIHEAFEGAAHVKHMSMDEVSLSATGRDIRSYISYRLHNIKGTFNADEIAQLAKRSDGLFEYARLACDYIKSTKAGLTAKERFDDLMSRTEKEGVELLDDMYNVILKAIMSETPNERVLTRFRSVMRHVLFTFEPLPIDALIAMHRSNEAKQGQFDAESTILRPMASLLSGIYDRSIPIRPLHSSFHDFLIDRARSVDFFVNETDAHLDLALASLSIMHRELQFNICRLESSYMRNSEIGDLAERVKQYISPQLSYSCRFLANHVEGIPFASRVADILQVLLGNEQTLFWVETLGVLQSINTLPESLLIIANWLEKSKGYENAAMSAKDGIQLVRHFGNVISESTPHLYLSVLPFLPQGSIFSQLLSKFPLIAKLASGQVADWQPVEFVLRGHTEPVRSVAFSRDGKYVVSGSYDNTICVWDTEAGVLVGRALKGHTGDVNSVVFSPDGRQVVSGSDDRSIRIWDTRSGSLVRDPICGHADGVSSVAFSKDGQRIVSGSQDKTICVWDVGTGQRIDKPFEGHFDEVMTVAFSPNGQRIISGSADTTVCVWDAMTGLQVFKPLQGHSESVTSVAFSPEGSRIVSGSDDHTICIWDAETGLQLGSPLTGHSGSVCSVFVSPNGKWILSGSADGTVRVWDIETRKNSHFKPPGVAIMAISMSPDGNKFVTGSSDSIVYIGEIGILQVEGLFQGHNQPINSVAFSPDGNQIVSCSDDCNVCIWDAETGALIRGPLECHSEPVNSVVFSPDGKKIASGSDDKTICILDAKTGLQGSLLMGHKDAVMCVAFLPDSQHIVSCSHDKTIRIWDVNTGLQGGKSMEGHSGAVFSIAISLGGKRIVSGSADTTICIWDVKTGIQVGSTLTGHTSPVCSVAFSPDGSQIVSGSQDQTVRIWDAQTGLQVGTSFGGHDNWVLSVAFSLDCERIVSGSADHTVRIWNAMTGMEVHSPLKTHTGGISQVAFSPLADGNRIVSCSYDITIWVWEVGLDSNIYKDINFSSKIEHTLCNAAELFDGTTASGENSRGYAYLNQEGWIVGPEGQLLLWVPFQYHKLLHKPGTLLALPDAAIELDLSVMAHGKQWMECFNANGGSTV